ncbi:glycosyltransferase involved in cell wall biosynthesis [Paenibacillus sp. VMFN-D1]|nr:glycosyltransferase involved in cell wall biosynthesis [Paenibacillus sp. VMFN-D1]
MKGDDAVGKIIGIDARKLENNKAGIGNYTYNLIREILEIDEHNTYILYTNNPIPIDFGKENCILKCLPVKARHRLTQKIKSPFWQNFNLRNKLIDDRVDIFFSPNFFKPLFYRGDAFLTIHDLTFITVPKAFSMIQRWYNRLFLFLSLQGRVEIFTVSNHSKQDILKHYRRIQENNVHITYCAVDTSKFKPLSELELDRNELVKKKYGLPDQYILFVGTIEPRKNLKSLLKSMSYLKQEGQSQLPLLICGSKGAGYQELIEQIEVLELKDHVKFTGYISDEDLPYLYANATLFIYPSLYEGFGIPPLEAMASGVPVITSNTSSIPEVVGEAAICIDPNNEKEMFEKIRLLLNDTQLRDKLIKQGLERATFFRWSNSARRFLSVLNQHG